MYLVAMVMSYVSCCRTGAMVMCESVVLMLLIACVLHRGITIVHGKYMYIVVMSLNGL